MSHIFSEYVSPVAWGVEVRKVEVMGEAATKAGIEAEWAAFAQGIGADDTVYVHYSGHGVIRDRAAGEQFLQACDLEEINRSEWAAQIEALPCRLKVFITDCCSSYPDEFVVAEGDERVIPWKNVYYLLMKHEGFVNITAASPGQPAYGTDAGGFLTINLESDIQRFRTWTEVFASAQARVLNESNEQLRGAGLEGEPQKPFAYSLGTPLLDLAQEDAAVAASLEYVLEDSADRRLSADELYAFGLEPLYLARKRNLRASRLRFCEPVSAGLLRKPLVVSAEAGFQESEALGDRVGEREHDPRGGEGTGRPVSGRQGRPAGRGRRDDGASRHLPLFVGEDALAHGGSEPDPAGTLDRAERDLRAARLSVLREGAAGVFRAEVLVCARRVGEGSGLQHGGKHNLWLIEKIERIQGGAHQW